MFWLQRPPYLRWIAAAAIVVAAVVWDLDSERTEPYPFAARPLTRTEPLTDADIEWRDVPAGLLPAPDLTTATLTADIGAGEPIVPSLLGDRSAVPEGWWAVPIDLPPTAAVGTGVRIVLATATIDGIVVATAPDDFGSYSDQGLVAVPAEHADRLARAVAEATVTVLIEP